MRIYGVDEDSLEPALFTPFTVIHFLTGLYAYIVLRFIFPTGNLLVLFLIWLILHTLYESKDCMSEGNSLLNCVGDTIATILGFMVGYGIIYYIDWGTILYGGVLLLTSAFLVSEGNRPTRVNL